MFAKLWMDQRVEKKDFKIRNFRRKRIEIILLFEFLFATIISLFNLILLLFQSLLFLLFFFHAPMRKCSDCVEYAVHELFVIPSGNISSNYSST